MLVQELKEDIFNLPFNERLALVIAIIESLQNLPTFDNDRSSAIQSMRDLLKTDYPAPTDDKLTEAEVDSYILVLQASAYQVEIDRLSLVAEAQRLATLFSKVGEAKSSLLETRGRLKEAKAKAESQLAEKVAALVKTKAEVESLEAYALESLANSLAELGL
jgi:hypothetical protein